LKLDISRVFEKKKFNIKCNNCLSHDIEIFITVYRSYKRRSEKLNDKYARYLYMRKIEM